MKSLLVILGVLAGLLGGANASAQELGRLFFTPEQRAALDARRKARVPDKPAATPQAESPITRINGAVQRSGGKSTVWVNGEAVPEGQGGAQGNPRVSSPGRVALPSSGDGSRGYDLRIGESLDRGSGEVRDVIGEGEIKVGPKRARPK